MAFASHLLAAVLLLPASGSEPSAEDLQTLRAGKVSNDGPALLAFFRQRTSSDSGRARIADLIRQLGDDRFREREKAAAALVAQGPVALPQLRQAIANPDLEVRRRAATCVHRIEADDGGATLVAAAARVLVTRRPAGVAEVLLAYLPECADDWAAEEVRAALAAVALPGGKPDPVLTAALEDASPLRRGAAAAALCRAGAAELRPAVRKLLHDADSGVRLRVSLSLAEAAERDAVPVLIDLLAELPPEQGWQVEEALSLLAGQEAPTAPPRKDDAGRRACRDAWAAWWVSHGDRVDLARLSTGQRTLGYTLVIVFEQSPFGYVAELGSDRRPRWRIDKLENPVDAWVLPGNRVLVAEFNANRVAVRSLKGNILWEKKVQGPIGCQPLPGGNTLVVTFNQILEVDPRGKEVASLGGLHLRAARKMRDGQLALVTGNGTYRLLDSFAGKELKQFPVQVGISNTIGGIDFTRDGHVLVSQADKVVEYDASGKVVWQAAVQRPDCITRLPTGHTLVGCTTAGRVFELDRAGKDVRQYELGDRPWLARRR